MQDNTDPRTWEISTWLLAFTMAFGGGVIDWISQYLGNVDAYESRCITCNVVSFAARVFIAGVIGLGVFMLIVSLGYSIGVSAALDGIAAHMGVTLLYIIEQKIKEKINKL